MTEPNDSPCVEPPQESEIMALRALIRLVTDTYAHWDDDVPDEGVPVFGIYEDKGREWWPVADGHYPLDLLPVVMVDVLRRAMDER